MGNDDINKGLNSYLSQTVGLLVAIEMVPKPLLQGPDHQLQGKKQGLRDKGVGEEGKVRAVYLTTQAVTGRC